MLGLVNAANTDDTKTTEFMAADFTPEMTDLQTEIGEEITNLWVAHGNAKSAARATKEELRILRAKLGEQLHEMKKMLVRPGRDGQWSAFLREHQIPRATADRLVSRHLRSLNPDAKFLNEPVSKPTEEDVQKLFASVWPKLRRVLRSRESVDLFIALLSSQFESSEATDREILVLASSAATTCPESAVPTAIAN